MPRLTLVAWIFPLLLPAMAEDQAALFDRQIAPLIARHCLECHDSTAREGKLDLSKQETALSGGSEGPAIVPGHPDQSPLWLSVESDEMPDDRPPLSAEEKAALKQWIAGGAVWSSPEIDPTAVHRSSQAAVPWARRLTRPEYIESVRATTGVDIAAETHRLLPADTRADGFSNTAYNLTVDLGHIEAYSRLAAIVTSKMDVAAHLAALQLPDSQSDDVFPTLIRQLARPLLRGPLDDSEVASYQKLAIALRDDGADLPATTAALIQAMLQSPRFLYRIENTADEATASHLSAHQIATRLSYFVLGAPPDEPLLAAADTDQLRTPEEIDRHVQRLLRDPRAQAQSRRFFSEWLNLDRLKHIQPDLARFPRWRPELADDMLAESLLLFDDVVWNRQQPLASLLTASHSYLTPRLARHYNIPPAAPPNASVNPDALASDPSAPASTDSAVATESAPLRITDSLVAWYRFDGDGDIVRDLSPTGAHLRIADVSTVAWTDEGLTLVKPSVLRSDGPADQLIAPLKKAKSLTVEAWVTPANTSQTGPARILTFSKDTGARNFTLGQEGDRWQGRLRTTTTNRNGQPYITSPEGAVTTSPTHVVYSRDSVGRARLYVNGEIRVDAPTLGDFTTWDEGFQFVIGNEASHDRPWLGTLHQIAIYDRALVTEEVRQNHAAGPRGIGHFEDNTASLRVNLAHVPSRRGILTHGSVLTYGGEDASMVARGLFVLHDVLHSAVGSAPPGVDTTPVLPKPGQSHRAVSEHRLSQSSCAGCHTKIEPLAFAFEKFDGLGAWRESDEHGNQLREDGSFVLPGQPDPIPYQSTAEFIDNLAASDRVAKTFVRKLAQFALGRPLVESDRPVIDRIHQSAPDSGHTYHSLVAALAHSRFILGQ